MRLQVPSRVRSLSGLGDTCLDSTGAIVDCSDPTATYDISNSSGTPAPTNTPASGSTLAQWIAALGIASQSATSAYKATQSPSLVPGTSVIYNPATGALSSGVATNLTALGSSFTSFIPLLLIGAVGLFLINSGKR